MEPMGTPSLPTMARPDTQFDPLRYRHELTAILDAIDTLESVNARSIEKLLKRHPKDGRGLFSRAQLIAGYRALAPEAGWRTPERAFLAKLRLRPIRTQSGVAPVTVLTQPYACPGRCIFCPSDVRMPKSYLSNEPGAQRATQHEFDPYRQTFARLSTFHQLGHDIDKTELIILGGTWSAYPERYQVWFVTRCFEAMNDFGLEPPNGSPPRHAPRPHRYSQKTVDGTEADVSYNDLVGSGDPGWEGSAGAEPLWSRLESAQRRNEHARARCVGLVVETRPDEVTAPELRRIRRLGGTKLQMGYQSLSDRVLVANRRGHGVETARRATRLARRAGFKIHGHWMPNLVASTPADDTEDFLRLFDDPGFRPDELKVYPLSLVESAELMRSYRAGFWRPYAAEELLRVLVFALSRTPRYCRLTRVIRDFPGPDIVTGNRTSNFRELAEAELKHRGLVPLDIRAREIGAREASVTNLRDTPYETTASREHFLEMVTPEDRIVGFVRLSLPRVPPPEGFDELRGAAIIREVHVYGTSSPLGVREAAQHRGLGTRLVREAEARARDAGYGRIAVISAVGTREYYRRLGYADAGLYLVRPLPVDDEGTTVEAASVAPPGH